MKKERWMSMMLSGAALMMLSLFVVPADSTTEVYSVPARFMKHTAGAQASLTQCFRATCDSILTLSFFNGWHPGAGTFTAELKDSASGLSVWNGSRPTAESLAYRDVGFTVNKGVGRGKTYKLTVGYSWNPGGPNYYFDAYFDTTNAYKYGKMEGYGDSVDLCAMVRGVNRTDSTFWGTNGELYWNNPQNVTTLVTKAKEMGMGISREQVCWSDLQPYPNFPDSIEWGRLDTVVSSAKAQGLRVMLTFMWTPKWMSTDPDTHQNSYNCNPGSTGWWYDYPPRNLDHQFNQQDSNYLWKFAYRLASRYGPQGVHDYEVYNEVSYYNAWRYGLYGDTLYYKNYDRTPSGRAKLYVLACSTAHNAILQADPQAKIYTNALGPINVRMDCEWISGKQWLQCFYDNYGKYFSDVITYHWYLHPDSLFKGSGYKKFWSKQFIADYDTLRRVMRDNGDGAKPVWADEGGYGAPPAGVSHYPYLSVSRDTQANIVVQATVTGLGQRENGAGPAIGQVNWYKLYDRVDIRVPDSLYIWYHWAGLVESLPGVAYKPSAYAYKQMTTKLKNLYFNRRVPMQDTLVWCYEFETPDTGIAIKRTWVLWRDTLASFESLAVFKQSVDSIKISYDGSEIPVPKTIRPSGKIAVWVDQVPFYIKENGTSSRPDVIVDSLWIYPDTARAGDNVWFYARIKNIGNATLSGSLPDTVTFQVDGVTLKRYGTNKQLATGDTAIVGLSIPAPPTCDWQATYGDHLIRAWADSADRYVELREDNNQGYLFKHMKPKGKVTIPGTSYGNGRKFTNTRYVTLSMLSNGGTIPHADSMRIKNDGGSWKPWRRDSTSWRDTLTTGDGQKKVYAEFKMVPSETSAIVVDSVILDQTLPIAYFYSPAHGATVNGTVTIRGIAYDPNIPTNGHFRVDTLWYFRDGSHHDTIHVSWVPIGNDEPTYGVLGTWSTYAVPNGLTKETLAVWDSAGNLKRDTITYTVFNKMLGGDGFAADFGTFSSPVMNVATDPAGNVYFAETQGSKIRKHSPRKDSLFAFSARRSDSTGLNWAVGMTLKDSTILYVADGYNHCIKAFDRQGNLLLRFGTFGSDTSQFKQPCGIALDHKRRIFVSDRLNNRIQVFDSTGHFLFQFGSQGQDSGKFNSPTGITITPNGLVWVSDTRNNQIQVFDSLGQYLKTIKAVDSLGLDTPLGICSDKYGDIFVADARHNRIVELNPFGERILDFGGLGDSLCQFRNPVGVATSPGAHYLYVADMGNRRVQRFTVILEDSSGGGPQGGAGVEVLPMVYELGPAIPNPSKGQTTFRYALPKESQVNFTFYNVAGQVVREYNQGKQKAGYYSITWDGRSNLGHKVGAGVYFYRLQAGNWAKTRKMVVIR